MTVIRTAIGKFAPEIHDAVARELADSEASLREAIAGLDGLIHFYEGKTRQPGTLRTSACGPRLRPRTRWILCKPCSTDVRCLNRSG